MKKSVLVLGSSSMISNYLAEKMSEMDYCVDSAGRRFEGCGNVNYLYWDIFNSNEAFYAAMKKEYCAVIVSAWSGNKPDEREITDMNMKCAESLIETLLNISKKSSIGQIVLLGSQAEYGSISGELNENCQVKPETLSAYGNAKLYLYNTLKECINNIPVTELRFHSVYGYYPSKKQMLTDVIKRMLNNEDVAFYSDGTHCYDFLYYKDAADAIISAVEQKLEGFYNVGYGTKKTFYEYINQVKQISLSESKVEFGQSSSADFFFNTEKFRNETGWKPEYSFERGVKEAISLMKYDDLKNKKIIIYGAGFCGLVFSDILIDNNIFPEAFFDNNPRKQNKVFNGIKVRKPYQCNNNETLVIVSLLEYRHFSEIKKTLLDMGYSDVRFIYEMADIRPLFRKQPLIFSMPENWREENMQNIKQVKKIFSDELSVVTYEKIIDFAEGKIDTSISAFPMNEQYFAYDVYKRTDNETFVDCGAFRGDILKFFCENNNNRFDKYYAIEPDPENYHRIEELCEADDERVKILPYALSDRNEKLYVKNYFNENSLVCNEGTEVTAMTLDDICIKYDINPTFIKIDVEGFEEKLLCGAENVINQYKPVIAIAIYHKCDDLWKIPLKIKKMLPEHKLFLRSYMNVNETILYAVPEERIADEVYK